MNSELTDEKLPMKEPGYAQEANCESASPRNILREVQITPLDTGFIVKVGCQSVAISSKAKLIEELTKYYINPSETESRYNSGEFGDKNEKY